MDNYISNPTILGAILGSIIGAIIGVLGLFAIKYWDNKNNTRKEKLEILKTLISKRFDFMDIKFCETISIVGIVFCKNNKVVSVWKTFLYKSDIKNLDDLIQEIVKDLKYSKTLDTFDLSKTTYDAIGRQKSLANDRTIKEWLANIAEQGLSIPVSLQNDHQKKEQLLQLLNSIDSNKKQNIISILSMDIEKNIKVGKIRDVLNGQPFQYNINSTTEILRLVEFY